MCSEFEKLLSLVDISEIVKNYPNGTEFYSIMCGPCIIDNIRDDGVISLRPINKLGTEILVDRKGRYRGSEGYYTTRTGYEGVEYMSECTLFPSEINRNWKSLTWKEGDILRNISHNYLIRDERVECEFSHFIDGKFDKFHTAWEFNYTLDGGAGDVEECDPNNWVFVRHTEKAEDEVRPLDTVLVRNSEKNKWICSILNRIESGYELPYVTNIGSFKYCIPYATNEELKGTNNNVETKKNKDGKHYI